MERSRGRSRRHARARSRRCAGCYQWWIRGYLAREGLPTDPLLPPSLGLAKEIENLPEQVRHLTTEAEVRAAVRALNVRIAAHLRAPSGPPVPVRPVNPDRVVAQWRAARPAAGN